MSILIVCHFQPGFYMIYSAARGLACFVHPKVNDRQCKK